MQKLFVGARACKGSPGTKHLRLVCQQAKRTGPVNPPDTRLLVAGTCMPARTTLADLPPKHDAAAAADHILHTRIQRAHVSVRHKPVHSPYPCTVSLSWRCLLPGSLLLLSQVAHRVKPLLICFFQWCVARQACRVWLQGVA